MNKTIFFCALMLACCTATFAQSDDKANVLAVERNTADAFSKHNTAALMTAFSDDINVISATGEILNKQQLLQTVSNINSVVLSDMKVRIEGYIALVTGVETETGKDNNGTAYTNKIRFTDVLERVKGNWIIIASQATAMQ